MFEYICMNGKHPGGRDECERNVWAAGESHGQDHGHSLQERQGSVLTNQCLGKKRINVERGAEESFQMDNDKLYIITSGSFVRPRLSYIINHET